MKTLGITGLALTLITFSAFNCQHADARLFKHKQDKHSATTHATTQSKAKSTTNGGTTKALEPNGGVPRGEDTDSPNGPIVVPPQQLDLTTAKFGRCEIRLNDARFLEASVRELRLSAENMDMEKGTLESLSIQADLGEFQGFTMDSMRIWTRGLLTFDTARLMNDKILQFREPATAHARVAVTQKSLNDFLNSPKILERLSSAAKKRVPILSTLARQDVNFGFSFLKADVKLQPENHVRISMDSKLGMGKVGVPVTLTAETQLQLTDGWLNLVDTKLITGGAAVPHDMAEKIVNRINSLSKWGTQSDDIKFQFTDLTVTPDDRLELEGSAVINRWRFVRNQEDKITEPANPLESESTNGASPR